MLFKADFVRRYKLGEFGNASPTWDSFTDYVTSGYSGLVHLRNRVAGGPTYYNVPRNRCLIVLQEAIGAGVKTSDLYVSAMAPEHLKIFQGEIYRSTRSYSLFYSCLPLPMREGLAKDGKQVYGATAARLMREFLNDKSFEWVQYLLDSYPDHVVEFSTYDVEWGTVPGHNTVFWEIRKY